MQSDASLSEPVYTDHENRRLSIRDLLEYFVRKGSMRVSDLHLKVGCSPAYRMDGKLEQIDGPPMDNGALAKIAKAMLSEERYGKFKEDYSVDSSFNYSDLQFRLNCFKDSDGLAIAIRALDASPPAVETIGFPNNAWQDMIARQYGLVLITGITGAGKSTTIASMLERIVRTRACRVITLEDPVEYRIRSHLGIVSQREIGRDVPSFERGLRDCLREDPDVIFVGEMRDRDAATWTLTAAETGHLVFSTLHTRDSRGSITRIIDMYPPSQQTEVANQLSLGLSHIVSQKLVPRADGKGRVVAMEILNNSYAMANLIRTVKVEQISSLLQTRTKDIPEERMTTLEHSLAGLVKEGLVEKTVAERFSNDPNAFHQALE